MKKQSLGYNVNAIRLGQIENDKLKKLSKASSSICHNEKEREVMEKAEEIGYNGYPIPEEYKNSKYSGVFKNGYERGKRRKYIAELQKKQNELKQVIQKLIEENKSLEDAPEEIKNDPSLVTYYMLCESKAKKGKGR